MYISTVFYFTSFNYNHQGILSMADTPTKINIDNKEYNIADLSPEVKSYINQIQFIDSKIIPLKAELASFQTARDVYTTNLTRQLEEKGEDKA